MTKSLPSIDMLAVLLLISFFIILPVSQNEIKIVGIFCTMVLVFLKLLSDKNSFYLDKEIFFIHIFLFIFSFIFFLVGLFSGYDGAIDQANIYMVWPSVYLLIFFVNNGNLFLEKLHLAICVSTIFIGFYTFIFFLTEGVNLLPKSFLIDLSLIERINLQGDSPQSRIYAISSMIFVVPYLISHLIIDSTFKKQKTITFIAFFSSLLIVFLGGRRALFVSFLVAAPISFIFQLYLPVKIRKYSLIENFRANIIILFTVIGMFSIISLFVNIDSQMILNDLLTSTDSGLEKNVDRAEQFEILTTEWSRSPIFGFGFGATVNGYSRNDEKPWAFELQYILLLFTTGIVGFSIFFISIVWIYTNLLSIISSNHYVDASYVIPILTGMTGFLIANATNPYFQAYGHIWVIFLAISIINFHRKASSGKM